MKRRTLRLLGGLLLSGFLGWAGSGVLSAWWISRREPPFPEPASAQADAALEELRLRTEDGVELGAWFLAGTDRDLPAVLVLHGRNGARSRTRWQEKRLAEAGAPVLTLTLRGHGDSGGDRVGFGWEERYDVLAGVAELERRLPERPLAIVATSLGAAATLFAADRLNGRIEGAFLDSPFVSLERAVRLRCDSALPWPFGSLAFEALWTFGPLVLDFDPERMRPLDHVEFLPAGMPLFLVNGAGDPVNPAGDLELFAAAAGPAAEVHILPGKGHAVSCLRAPEEYRRLLAAFLERVLQRP